MYAVRWVSAVIFLVLAPWAAAQVPVSPAPIAAPIVSVASATIDLSGIASAWVEDGTSATAAQVAMGKGRFQVPPARSIHRTGDGKTLWLKLALHRDGAQPAGWILQFAMPVIDSITVYQRNGAGNWIGQSAGDTLHMGAWPEPGRYPFFRMTLAEGETRQVLVRVRHSTPVSLPIRLVSEATHDLRIQTEYLGLGAVFGAISLLVGLCAIRGWTLRDWAYGWYTTYALVSLLAVAAYTGVAAQLLWTDAGSWIDASPGVLAMLAAAAALLIVRSLSGVVSRHRWLGRAIMAAAIAGPIFATVYLWLPRPTGVAMLGLYLLIVAALSLAAAAMVWRRGDEVGVWMLAGALPLALAVMLVLAAVFGLIQASWITEYALVSGIALALPTLYGALHNRSRERRSAEFRQRASSSQDALTGLLTARVFQARLAQAIARFRNRREGAAVMLIELANYAWIKQTHGSAVAEQCLLRGVILLRRLVRDVDTTGRVGEARFGLLLEGIASRDIVTDRATRLLAAGLREPPHGSAEVLLQFHVSAALLDERVEDPAAMMFALGDLLSGMSARTRHPIRFLNGDLQSSRPVAEPIMQA